MTIARSPRDVGPDEKLLRRAGEALYGEFWQRPLARLLSTVRGRPVNDRTVRRAIAGSGIPGWWWGALASVFDQRVIQSGQPADRALHALLAARVAKLDADLEDWP